MPEAKKISELPVLSSVQPDDIVPIVDAELTQTSRCTASQIAAIGGGPPGVDTVNATHIQNGAIPAAKMLFTGPDKLFSRTASGAGQATEIACTPYARELLTKADAEAARLYLQALQSTNNPEFTGQVKGADGTAAAPSYSFSSDTDTGIYLSAANTLAFATSGVPRFYIDPSGAAGAALSTGALYAAYFARAICVFDGSTASPTLNFSAGIATVTRPSGSGNNIGIYQLAFDEAMPDEDYAVAVTFDTMEKRGDPASSPASGTIAAGITWVGNKTVSGFAVQIRQWDYNSGTPRWIFGDPIAVNITVFR